MSRLSVYWPDETDSAEIVKDEPRILPFPTLQKVADFESRRMDVVTRARILFANRKCRDCGYPVVEPIELQDSMTNLSGLAIPGTATLIGFHCCGCQNEWPAC